MQEKRKFSTRHILPFFYYLDGITAMSVIQNDNLKTKIDELVTTFLLKYWVNQ